MFHNDLREKIYIFLNILLKNKYILYYLNTILEQIDL